MSIASEITRLQNAKVNIKTAIEAKGVEIPSNATLDEYSDYIEEIPSGGTDTRWQEIGYEEEPKASEENFNTLKEIYNNWDNARTDVSRMFYQYGENGKYTIDDFPKVDTSNVTNMKQMFYRCYTLRETNFDYSKCTNMEEMYRNCYALKYVHKVLPNSTANIKNMFAGCNNLKEIEEFKVPNNSNNSYIISGSGGTQIKDLKINKLILNTSLSSFNKIFSYCNNLNILEIQNIGWTKFEKVLFENCTLSNNTIKATLIYLKTLTTQATNYKTLKAMGFNKTDSNTATTFTEWQELADAGWTTGY